MPKIVVSVDTNSGSGSISRNAIIAFRSVAAYIPEHIPIILEPLIDNGQSDLLTE